MVRYLSVSDMVDSLVSDEYARWSPEGARVLAEHLDCECESTAEWDRVAIRCEWSEYESVRQAASDLLDWSPADVEISADDLDYATREEILDQYASEALQARYEVLEVSTGHVVVREW
jgi:hypothetical protein